MALKDMILAAIKKAAGNPEHAIARSKTYDSIDNYWAVQYLKMTGSAVLGGVPGAVVGSVLTVGAMAGFLRCAANMTYAYGNYVGAVVDDEDFFAVLAIWMGKNPNDIVGQATNLLGHVRLPQLKAKAAEIAAFKIAEELAERLAVYAAESLAARVATKIVAGIVPFVGSVVAAAIVTNDYNKISAAIKTFYNRKLNG